MCIRDRSYVALFTTHVQTCLGTNKVVASYENTDFEFWLVNIARESRHIWELHQLLQNQFALSRPVKREACRDFVAKSRTTPLYFLQHFCRNLQQFDFLKDRFFYSWVVKCPTSHLVARFDFVAYFTDPYSKSLKICSLWSEGFWEAVAGGTMVTVEA